MLCYISRGMFLFVTGMLSAHLVLFTCVHNGPLISFKGCVFVNIEMRQHCFHAY